MSEFMTDDRTHQSAPKQASPMVGRVLHALNRHRYCKSANEIQNRTDLFVPNSGGPPEDLTNLTLQSISQTIPFLADLADASGRPALRITTAEEFCAAPARPTANRLADLFNKHGSDKSSFHNYHLVYGKVAHDLGEINAMLEIGMGTNNTDVTSHMGALGKPGASLRAFRDFSSNGRIFGADIDSRILFHEDRIETFAVDQTDATTLSNLGKNIPGSLDLIIDDGLHSPNANLNVILFALQKVRAGGWIIIEDIPQRALPLWRVADALMPDNYDTWAVRCQSAYVYAARKLR